MSHQAFRTGTELMNTTARTRSGPPGQDAPETPRRRPARPSPARDAPARQSGARQADPRQKAPRQAEPRQEATRQADPRQAPSRPGPRGRQAAVQPDPARQSQPRTAAPGRRSSRTPFILFVIGLLASGLVCLLVINTTLAAGSFQISKLQQENTAATQRVAQLQQQVSADQSPASIEQRALRLGMRTQSVLNFLDLRNGRHYSTAAHLPPNYNVPGYTP